MIKEECPAAEPYVCMVCSIDKGGCGASTGYYDSAEKANAAWNRRAQPENEPCADCTGIMYRQTASGKIIPADSKCPAAVPTCYQPDGDGCAYQIYGDNNDEPIDRCKECPLCYADKARRKQPGNEALTLSELRGMGGEPLKHWVWIEILLPETWPYEMDSGYYRNILDHTGGEAFCYGYPGWSTGLPYDDYGKTWLAYRTKPERSEG